MEQMQDGTVLLEFMDARPARAAPGFVKPTVLAVIPCLNEAAHIESIAVKLLEDADILDLMVVIADGGSTDGTAEIARRLAASDPRIAYVDNPKRIQSAAVNRAVEVCGGERDYLIRVDAHCGYPDHYCRRLIEAQAASGAASVVVSMAALGETCFQCAAAAAQNSRLGNGGSAHRLQGQGRFVEHGHHALIRLAAFHRVGGYDEGFSHNEDAEFDARLGKAQFGIWLSAESPILYFPRSTAGALFRQYLNYGRGRAKTLIKHRQRLRLRQTLPLAVAPAFGLALLAPLHPAFALPALLWAGLSLIYGIALGLQKRDICAALSGVAAIVMHLGWSAGFLSQMARFFLGAGVRRQRGSQELSQN